MLVRSLFLASSLVLVSLAAPSAFARDPVPSVRSPDTTHVAAPTQTGSTSFSPAASEAVQVVNAFMTAIAGGRLEAARQLMTPDAVVLANGNVLGERDAYIDGAAKGDAAALGSVQRDLLRRDAKAAANFGWVVSETSLRQPGGGQGPNEVVTETMLLSRMSDGWKITHIHWSGRHAR